MRLALEMYRGPRTTGHSEDVRLGLDRQEANGLTFGCPRLTLASSNYPNGYPEMAIEEEDLQGGHFSGTRYLDTRTGPFSDWD